MKKKTYLLLMLLIPMLSMQAVTRYVKTTGDDLNDGLTWATAKLTIPAALTASAIGDVVYVAGGTYVHPDATTPVYTVKDGVNVYGGYNASTGLRDLVNQTTVLTPGQTGFRVLQYPGTPLTVETIWDGFTITGGNRATDASGVSMGTLFIVSNCIISGNSSDANNGGAISCFSGGKLLNCIIENNTTGGTGGAFFTSSASYVIIENCIIRNNKSTGTGGSGGFVLKGTSIMKNCIVANNEAPVGPSGAGNAASSAKIINCTIVNNKAARSGGIYMGQTSSIQNSIVWNNISTTTTSPVIAFEPTATMTTCAIQSGTPANGSFLLNASNTATDGPNFVAPSTIIGNTTEDIESINWRIKDNSPCIDAGTDYTDSGVTTDIVGTLRPWDRGFDIGAYEFDGTTAIDNIKDMNVLTIYPNPIKDVVTLNVQNINSIKVYNVAGLSIPFKHTNSQIDVSTLAKGIYTFVINADNKNYVARAIKN